MASKALAKTTFESGPDAALAAVDIYGKPPTVPIGGTDAIGASQLVNLTGALGGNNLFGDFAQMGIGGAFGNVSSALSNLGGITGGFTDLKTSIGTVTGILNGDVSFMNEVKDNMMGDILASVGYSPETINGIVDSVAAVAKGNFDPLEQLALNNPKLKVVMNGINIIRSAKDIDSIEDLINLTGKITGNPDIAKIVQIGPEINMLKTLYNKALDLGIPELGEAILGRFDNDDHMRNDIRIGTAHSAAYNSQLDYLGELVNDYGAPRLNATTTNLVSVLLANYQLPIDAKGIPTLQHATNLINRCNELDKNWLTTTLDNGTECLRLDYFTNLSADARATLLLHDEYVIHILAAPLFPEVSIRTVANRSYPYMPPLDEYGNGLAEEQPKRQRIELYTSTYGA